MPSDFNQEQALNHFAPLNEIGQLGGLTVGEQLALAALIQESAEHGLRFAYDCDEGRYCLEVIGGNDASAQ